MIMIVWSHCATGDEGSSSSHSSSGLPVQCSLDVEMCRQLQLSLKMGR